MGADASKNIEILTQISLTGHDSSERLVPWTLYKAEILNGNDKLKAENVSIFDYVEDVNNRDHSLLILKSIRHPNIIQLHRYHTIFKSKKDENCYLITETVTPLVNSLAVLTINELLSGIHDILNALNFLHTTANISHNDINILSIFIGSDHTWKLGNFEKARSHYNDPLGKDKYNKAFKFDGDGLIELVDELTEQEYENLNEHEFDLLKSIGEEMKQEKCNDYLDIENYYNKNGIVKRSEFVQILTFLRDIVLKSREEKDAFFNSLASKLSNLPEDLITKRLVTHLTQRFVFLDEMARLEFLPHFLSPKTDKFPSSSVLSEKSFSESVIPVLLKIFSIRETSIRLVLLENFQRYCMYISGDDLKSFVLDELLLSARESDDRLVQHSLMALSYLVPILGGDVVMGPNRTKYFFDGNIKKNLHEDTNHKVPSSELNKHSNVNNLLDVLKKTKIEKRLSDRQKTEPMSSSHKDDSINWIDAKNTFRTEFSRSDSAVEPINDLTEKSVSIGGNNLIKSESVGTDIDKFSSKLQRPVAIIEPKTTYHKPSCEDLTCIKDQDDDDTNDGDNANENELSSPLQDEIKSEFTSKNNENGKGEKLTSNTSIINNISAINTDLTRLNTSHSQCKGALKLAKSEKYDVPKKQEQRISTKPKQNSTNTLKKGSNDKSEKTILTNSPINDVSSEWGDAWEPVEEIIKGAQMNQDSSKNKNQNPPKDKNQDTNKNKPNDRPKTRNTRPSLDEPLGFGYDIKMVEIRKNPNERDEEDDIFSELTPQINFQHTTNSMNSVKNSSTNKKAVSSKMDYQHISNLTDDGDNEDNQGDWDPGDTDIQL